MIDNPPDLEISLSLPRSQSHISYIPRLIPGSLCLLPPPAKSHSHSRSRNSHQNPSRTDPCTFNLFRTACMGLSLVSMGSVFITMCPDSRGNNAILFRTFSFGLVAVPRVSHYALHHSSDSSSNPSKHCCIRSQHFVPLPTKLSHAIIIVPLYKAHLTSPPYLT